MDRDMAFYTFLAVCMVALHVYNIVCDPAHWLSQAVVIAVILALYLVAVSPLIYKKLHRTSRRGKIG